MGRLQVNASRGSKGAVSVRYRPKARITLTGGSPKVFVRVSDKAGNWTKWKKAKVIVNRR